jgi:hypothetical protein
MGTDGSSLRRRICGDEIFRHQLVNNGFHKEKGSHEPVLCGAFFLIRIPISQNNEFLKTLHSQLENNDERKEA